MACDFPAGALLQERRAIAESAANSDDDQYVQNCAEFVLRCDQLRLLHQELTGCNCWQQALAEAR